MKVQRSKYMKGDEKCRSIHLSIIYTTIMKKKISIYIYICIIHTYTTQHVLHPLSNRNALQAVMLRWQLSALRFTSPQRGGEKKNTPEVETGDLMLCVYIYSTTYQKHRFEDIINEKGQPLV